VGPIKLIGKSLTINELSGCPGEIGMQDFTTMKADVAYGATYTLEYELVHCGTNGFPFQAGAWIDFNQDGTWTDAERIMTVVNTYGLGQSQFTVPVAGDENIIKAGPTRMRVQMQESARLPYDPCATFGYGGTKDFTVEVRAPGGGGGSSGGLSGGWIFIILLIIFTTLYLAIGCAFNRTQRGTTTLKDSCPNNLFWTSLYYYVKDGCHFTYATIARVCCKKNVGGATYGDMPDDQNL